MKFSIILLDEALAELNALDEKYIKLVEKDYYKIENLGIGFVHIDSLLDNMYEIKSGQVRSIFGYRKGKKIIVAVVFLKKSQKTPELIKKLAKRRLENYDKQQ